MENNEKVEKLINLAIDKNIFDLDEINQGKGYTFGPLNKPMPISITGFQRVLGIGYPSAKDLMEYLIENEAVTEDNGRYFILSLEKYIILLVKRYNAEISEGIYINGRISDIESTHASEYYLKRLNDRNKYFSKKGDYNSVVINDFRTLIKKRTEFNIPKEQILEFYDSNKKQIIDWFNLNSKIIEDDSKFMYCLDYDERVFADKNGKVHSCIKIYPTNQKSKEEECLCLLCLIIKILWNRQNKNKIYMYKMYKYVCGEFNEEIEDYYINEMNIKDPFGEDLPF